jgi:hypothetical protein
MSDGPNDYDRDLDRLLETVPPETRQIIDAQRRLNQENLAMVMRMYRLRTGLAWLLAGNLAVAVLNAVLLLWRMR